MEGYPELSGSTNDPFIYNIIYWPWGHVKPSCPGPKQVCQLTRVQVQVEALVKRDEIKTTSGGCFKNKTPMNQD